MHICTELKNVYEIYIRKEKKMTDIITYCDVIEDCKDCPRYAWECDGDKRIESEADDETDSV